MRSPLGARFPARYRSGLPLLFVVLFVPSCISPEPRRVPAAPEPSMSEAPAGAGDATDGPAEGTGPQSSVRGTEITGGDSKRTVRGHAPRYIEIETAAVEGSVGVLRFRAVLAGAVPEQMPDRKSVLRATFSITTKAGQRYTFEAQCVRPGWGTFASGGPPDAPIPEVIVEGPRIDVVVDPAYIGGLQPFDWMASVAWTSGTANYAFDSAPKSGLAAYP